MKLVRQTLLCTALIFSSCNEEWVLEEEPEVVVTPEEGPAPDAPELLAPEDQKTCEEGIEVSTTHRSITFSWSPSENTSSYDLKVTNLENENEQYKSNITSTSETMVLQKNYPYSWQVTSRSVSSSQSSGSSIWQFYVPGDGLINYAPFPAVVIKPTSGSLVIPNQGKTTLQWQGADPDNDALTYTLYFDTVDGFQSPQPEHISIEESSVEVSVQPETIYYWRVKTSDGNNSSYTVVKVFQTTS